MPTKTICITKLRPTFSREFLVAEDLGSFSIVSDITITLPDGSFLYRGFFSTTSWNEIGGLTDYFIAPLVKFTRESVVDSPLYELLNEILCVVMNESLDTEGRDAHIPI